MESIGGAEFEDGLALLAESPFRGSLDFDDDGIDADFAIGYDVEKKRLTFEIEQQEFKKMAKIPMTKRKNHAVYRIERNVNNQGR